MAEAAHHGFSSLQELSGDVAELESDGHRKFAACQADDHPVSWMIDDYLPTPTTL